MCVTSTCQRSYAMPPKLLRQHPRAKRRCWRSRIYDLNGNAWADLSSGGALLERRLYDDAVDKLDARIDTSGIFWYLTDVLGSVRDIAGSNGLLLDHRDYDLWGAI